MTKHRPPCPRCGAAVALLIYGLPSRETEERVANPMPAPVFLAGCCVPTPAPTYRCTACDHELYLEPADDDRRWIDDDEDTTWPA